MSFAIVRIDLRVLNMKARMPFKYGIAALTALPHLMVFAECEIDGRRQVGVAADGLPPKWFTKDPATTFEQDLADMLAVVRTAGERAVASGAAGDLFDWWWPLYTEQLRWGETRGFPPLLSGFGMSLIERAALDALCRAQGSSFAEWVRSGDSGIDLGRIHGELAGTAPAAWLPSEPRRSMIARHTVGLADPLTAADVPADERIGDGLPQTLAEVIQTYGITHFKLKVSGDPARDLDRLSGIARVIEAEATPDYAFTLDGNEQYADVEAFCAFWAQLHAAPGLRGFLQHLLFVEQPLRRDVALSEAAARSLQAWQDRPPIIIDESDGELQSLPRALAAGYAGTSHKNCKGVIKGVANACLLAQRAKRLESAGRTLVLSGEDLANVGPVALLQDLAVAASLGVGHVERNGHHYFAGLSMWPDTVQRQALAVHGDLYREQSGYPALAITAGRLDLSSVVRAPFGCGFELDPKAFTPLADWRYESLDLA